MALNASSNAFLCAVLLCNRRWIGRTITMPLRQPDCESSFRALGPRAVGWAQAVTVHLALTCVLISLGATPTSAAGRIKPGRAFGLQSTDRPGCGPDSRWSNSYHNSLTAPALCANTYVRSNDARIDAGQFEVVSEPRELDLDQACRRLHRRPFTKASLSLSELNL